MRTQATSEPGVPHTGKRLIPEAGDEVTIPTVANHLRSLASHFSELIVV